VDRDLFAHTARRLAVPFDLVVTAQDVGSYKPSPDNFRVLIERSGLGPEGLLHVAQSVYHDVVPARALGLATVRVNRRSGRRGGGATLPAEGRADMEVPDLATLAALCYSSGPTTPHRGARPGGG
jgi:2-haloacid dehalogenase